jgi:transglutaminase-like putative cysteine protease
MRYFIPVLLAVAVLSGCADAQVPSAATPAPSAAPDASVTPSPSAAATPNPATPEPTPTPEPVNTAPPVIYGTRDILVFLSDAVIYRKDVSAFDSLGNELFFMVDSSEVDTGKAGEYPAFYSAQDKDGNRTEVAITVTVAAISADRVLDRVDTALASIIKEGMTDRERARAIFNWIAANVSYVYDTPHDPNIYEGAYRALQRRQGDCYTLYAISEVMLTRAEIPNMRVTRVGGRSSHFWNLVYIEDEGWYFFDTTPPNPSLRNVNRFLFTVSDAQRYTDTCFEKEGKPNYYTYDPELYPEIVR